jgi:predicted nucleic acid-binding protein
VELLLRREAYERLADLLLAPGEVLHAPHLLDVEVAQVLRRLEQAGPLSTERAEEALSDLRALRIVRYAHQPLLTRAWALRHNLSAYDALYVALAEGLEAPLVTTDRRLASAPGHDAKVILA